MPQQMTMPDLNLFEYPEEICSECGNNVFAPGIIFKKVPGVALGEGGDTVTVPIKVAYCTKCGALSPSDREVYDKETAKAAEKKKNSQKSANSGGLIL